MIILSPIEFNLFFDDIDEIFNDPLPIDSERKIRHLSSTDDLAMFSLSKAGLQKCLDNLLIYCNKWGLEVSIKKTNAFIMTTN